VIPARATPVLDRVWFSGPRARSFISSTVGRSHRFSATADARVLLFTLVIYLVTAVLFEIAPAMRSSRTNVAGALNTSTRSVRGAAARQLMPNRPGTLCGTIVSDELTCGN